MTAFPLDPDEALDSLGTKLSLADAPRGAFVYCPVCLPMVAWRFSRHPGHVTNEDDAFFRVRLDGLCCPQALVSQFIEMKGVPGAIVVRAVQDAGGAVRVCDTCGAGIVHRISYEPNVRVVWE